MLLAAMLGTAVVLTSCESNPVASGGDPICEHADADGFVLDWRGFAVASQWQAVVSGGIELDAGARMDSLRVVFLDPDSARMDATTFCDDKELRWVIADSSVASFTTEGGVPFAVSVLGKVEGSTTVRFQIWHVDHADFTSQPIPIMVRAGIPHDPIGAAQAVLFSGCNRIATWNFGVEGATGVLIAPLAGTSQEIGVQFLDATSHAVEPMDSGYSLGWSVADTTVAAIAPVSGSRWSVRVSGRRVGHTTAIFALRWLGNLECALGPLDIVIEDPHAAPAIAPSFLLKKSGVRHAFVQNGTLVPSCGATMATGFLPAQLDTIEDLFQFRLLDFASCSETTPSPSFYRLAFEFADACIAGIVNHPEHIGEHMEFHLRGIAAGSTTLRIRLLHRNTVAFVSPPIPVIVTSTGAARAGPG
jgi:hypothetical protein